MPSKPLTFFSGGLELAARLDLPENFDAKKPPLIIMAHGLGAQKDFGLDKFAINFTQNGMAALTFDYRYFGESRGEPRNLVDPWAQLEDWNSALNFAQTLEEIDTSRMALWGTSFAGGHVLKIASQHPEIKAVVAQVPAVDGLASSLTYSPLFLLKASSLALLDYASQIFLNKPLYIPLVGASDDFAVMNKADSPEYFKLVPPDSAWKNQVPARLALMIPLYRPIAAASRIKAPVLIVYGDRDTLIPYKAVEKTAEKIPRCRKLKLPIGHFEVYDRFFERVIAEEIAFLQEQLA